MKYLRRLLILCRVIFARFDRLPDQISPHEMTTHFLFVKEHFNPTKKTVKYAAYLPPKSRLLSIYRTSGCRDEKIWWFGDWYVAPKRGKPVIARADLSAGYFARVQLVISASKADRVPHPRHANIIGWPEDKPSQKMKAMELANNAEPFEKPAYLN